MRRCGKSVLLGLIQGELRQQGVLEAQLLSLNFESAPTAHLLSGELATYLAGRYVEITLLGKGRVSVPLQLPFFRRRQPAVP